MKRTMILGAAIFWVVSLANGADWLIILNKSDGTASILDAKTGVARATRPRRRFRTMSVASSLPPLPPRGSARRSPLASIHRQPRPKVASREASGRQVGVRGEPKP
jgi:hypothetical protein